MELLFVKSNLPVVLPLPGQVRPSGKEHQTCIGHIDIVLSA